MLLPMVVDERSNSEAGVEKTEKMLATFKHDNYFIKYLINKEEIKNITKCEKNNEKVFKTKSALLNNRKQILSSLVVHLNSKKEGK